MDGRNYFCEIKKQCFLKKLFPAIKHSNIQGKNVLLGTTTLDHSLFLWAAFSLRFLSVIPSVCYFSVYKLIDWDPASIYLSKVDSIKTRKMREIWRKLTTKTVESGSVAVIVNFEHISHLSLVFLLLILNG